MAISGRYLLHQIYNGKTAEINRRVATAGFSDTWASFKRPRSVYQYFNMAPRFFLSLNSQKTLRCKANIDVCPESLVTNRQPMKYCAACRFLNLVLGNVEESFSCLLYCVKTLSKSVLLFLSFRLKRKWLSLDLSLSFSFQHKLDSKLSRRKCGVTVEIYKP